MKNNLIGLLIAVAGLLSSTISFAEGNEPPTPKNTDHPCLEEVKKLCPGIQMGPELGKCIQQNKDKFSTACQARMKEGSEKMKALIEDCKGDVKKLCADIKPGGGRIFSCLKSNEAKLTSACKAQIEHKPGT